MYKKKLILVTLFSILVLALIFGLSQMNMSPESPESPDSNKNVATEEQIEDKEAAESEEPDEAENDEEIVESENPNEAENENSEKPKEEETREDEEIEEENGGVIKEEADVKEESSPQKEQPTNEPGTKPEDSADVIKTKNQTEETVIAFKTVKVNDETLEKGKTKVSVEGKNGILATTYKLTYVNEQLDSKLKIKEVIKVKPIDKVVKVGTKATTEPKPEPTPEPEPIVKTYDDVKTESIAFKTEERNDDTLEEGQTKVIQEGVNGEKTLKYRVTTTDGKETSRKLLSEEVTKQPINKIIAIGTKKAETWMDRVERKIPSGYSIAFNPAGDVIKKNGQYVGVISFIGLKMEKSIGRASHEKLADFWIAYRSELGASTNRSDLFSAINKYYEDGGYVVVGKIEQSSSSTELLLRHY